MENKICPYCHSEIETEATFCTVCGVPQTSRTEAFPPEPTPQQWPRQETQYIPNIPTPQQPVRPVSVPKQPKYYGENGSGMGWIVFMRVILWIIFAATVIAGVVNAVYMFDYDLVVEGIAVILCSILAAFIVVGGGMVALNSASNSRKTANNTAKILQVLQEQNEK